MIERILLLILFASLLSYGEYRRYKVSKKIDEWEKQVMEHLNKPK